MTKVAAFIQARMSSSRFPGKVIADLNGMPMIVFMVLRVRQARRLDSISVVTSTEASDDALVDVLTANGISVFRGDLNDVLARFLAAAAETDAEAIVRLTGDCPLADPGIIDRVVAACVDGGADYASNIDPASFADGLDVECFTRPTLERASLEAHDRPEREHVTLWMRSERAALRRANVANLIDSAHLRLTVDYPDDLEVVRAIVAAHDRPAEIDQYSILRCLDDDRTLLERNRHERNEGLRAAPSSPAN